MSKIDELMTAVEEGRVELMVSSNVLVDDGSTKLLFIPPEKMHLGPETFGFTMQDDGGFTGMFMTKKSWEEMKTKVDKFIQGLVQ